MDERNKILIVENLYKRFFFHSQKILFKKEKYVQVLNGINLSVNEGETLGIVGESGCGKSTIAKIIMDIYSPTKGSIKFHNRDITLLKGNEKKRIRKSIQYVFQDPMGALNPRIPVIKQVYEPLIVHYGKKNVDKYYKKAVDLIESVGLKESHGNMYPHQLSGGQRQRIVLARAMILEPEILICDEPFSALDVSIQAQVVNVLLEIKKQKDITILFISHDLSMVRHLCNRIAVIYMGNIVEYGNCDDIISSPLHPYTKSLINAIPVPDPRLKREDFILEGEIPSLLTPPSGCKFHPRCPIAMEKCSQESPELKLSRKNIYCSCLAIEMEGKNE